jgi:hypothetical protein
LSQMFRQGGPIGQTQYAQGSPVTAKPQPVGVGYEQAPGAPMSSPPASMRPDRTDKGYVNMQPGRTPWLMAPMQSRYDWIRQNTQKGTPYRPPRFV